MAAVKISSKVEESVWNELRELAEESHQTISGLLTEAIREYVNRRRVRPEVMKHLEDSMRENDELGRLLSQRCDPLPDAGRSARDSPGSDRAVSDGQMSV